MITTFERLAKVIKGEAPPANWIESAFANLLTKLLPTVTSSDKNKVLTVNTSGKWVAKAPSGGLPSVTAADEGKVLTVNSSGEWDAETPSSGGGDYVLLAEVSLDNDIWVLNKTAAEIIAAKGCIATGNLNGSSSAIERFTDITLIMVESYKNIESPMDYGFEFYDFTENERFHFAASTLNDYPVCNFE